MYKKLPFSRTSCPKKIVFDVASWWHSRGLIVTSTWPSNRKFIDQTSFFRTIVGRVSVKLPTRSRNNLKFRRLIILVDDNYLTFIRINIFTTSEISKTFSFSIIRWSYILNIYIDLFKPFSNREKNFAASNCEKNFADINSSQTVNSSHDGYDTSWIISNNNNYEKMEI